MSPRRPPGLSPLLAIGVSSVLGLAAAQPGPLRPPVVRTHVDAEYPRSALAARRDAEVVVLVSIDAQGHVTKVEVVQSGGGDLDAAATTAAQQWTFTPAMRGDAAVPSRIRIPFHFAPPPVSPEVVPAGDQPVPSPQGASDPPATPATPARPGPPAAAPADAPVSTGAVTTPEEEVTIVGRAAAPSHGASDFNLRVGMLARVPRQNATEILKLAPGILLTNEGGEGHAEQVFLRGFDAREGQDLEFTVGGVPINESGNLHGNGLANTHFIIPELVQSLRVLEGPFDPRQGNYAVAGSANYELGLEQRGATAKYMRGSFGTERMLLLWGPGGESTHTFGGVELYKTDGYGQNRDAQRGSGMAQYEGRLGKDGSFRVTGTAFSTTFHSAGVLRDDDFRAGRKGFYDTYDFGQGGDNSRYSIAADLETRSGDTILAQQVFLISNAMRLRENFTGFLLDVQTPLQNPHGQRGDMLDLNVSEFTIGGRGSARVHGKLFGERQELEFGYYARGDSVEASQQRLGAGTNIPYRTETNLASKIGDIGLYADVNARLASWLVVRGGLRGDLFTFDVNNLCAVQDVSSPSRKNPPGDASCLAQQAQGVFREPNQRATTSSTALMPRASILFGPFERVTLSASYGTGVRSIDPSYVSQDIKTPFARIQAYEGGVAYAGGTETVEVLARSVFFQTHVDQDLIFNETAGRNTLASGTTRTGWIGAARATGPFFDEAANVTLVRSVFDDSHLLVPYVPDVVVRSDTSVFADLPAAIGGSKIKGAVGAGVTYVGPRPLPFGARSQDIFTVDASLTFTWTHYELGFLSTNLLDRRYRLGEYNYASDFRSQPQPTLTPMRQFAAGAPRGIFATFGVNVGGS